MIVKKMIEEKIKEIFEELDISGDIAPLEDAEDYWKRKLIEVFEVIQLLLKLPKNKMEERVWLRVANCKELEVAKETFLRENWKEIIK